MKELRVVKRKASDYANLKIVHDLLMLEYLGAIKKRDALMAVLIEQYGTPECVEAAAQGPFYSPLHGENLVQICLNFFLWHSNIFSPLSWLSMITLATRWVRNNLRRQMLSASCKLQAFQRRVWIPRL